MKTLSSNPELLSQNNKQFDPLDWWIYNFARNGIDHGEEYIIHPVCEFSEVNFLLYLLKLQTIYSNKRKLKQNHLETVTVYSYDRKLKTSALAIKKNKMIPMKKSNDYKIDFGIDTYLIINTALAGTVCLDLPRVLTKSKHPVVKTIKPLTYNASWVPKLLIKEIDTYINPPKPYDLDLLKEGLRLVNMHGYLEAIITILNRSDLPVDQEAFLRNSQIPTVNYDINKVRQDRNARLMAMNN